MTVSGNGAQDMSTGNFGSLVASALGSGTGTFTNTNPERTGLCNDILKRCTYKPGWELWVDGDSHTRWIDQRPSYADSRAMPPRVLRIKAHVIDSNDHSRVVEITHSFSVPEAVVMDEEMFLRFVANSLVYTERHESKEFFMVDGTRFEDPHRDANARLYQ